MRLTTPMKVVFAGPVDTRFSVRKYSDLNTLVGTGLVYAYMKVVCLDDGKTYELQDDLITWKNFSSKGEKGDKGDKGDPGPAITAGTVTLSSGNSGLQITIDPVTGELDFNLTLPPYILGEETQDLHTQDKTLIGAINEIYDMITS